LSHILRTKNKMEQKIKETFEGLKDFQKKTVQYVFEQLYLKGRDKMLIADEVGLGKTIVAKGIIARAFEKIIAEENKKKFSVIYICSNQALAKQNLRKLNFTGDNSVIDYSEEDDRITSLAYVPSTGSGKIPFKIKAFTPATSFNDKTSAGRASERILLYRLLYSYKEMMPYKNSLKWIFKDNRKMNDSNWEKLITSAEQFDKNQNNSRVRKIRPRVFSKLRKELNKTINPDILPESFKAAKISYPVKYWTLIKNLAKLGVRKNNYYYYDFTRELIRNLRFLLSQICVDYLQADIFVLDEFQRYKQLIDNSSCDERISPAIEIAREIFANRDSKIIMLSATPFKPFTNEFDELNGEEHFKEFQLVLKFLMSDKNEDFWKQYEKDRRQFFSFLKDPDYIKGKKSEAVEVKNKLESLYRQVIVRTEKLIASKEKDVLIKRAYNRPLDINKDDIDEFILMDKITNLLNDKYNTSLNVPIEYVKSSPFSLSFLDNYMHKEKLKKIASGDEKIKEEIKKTKKCWIDLEKIDNYKPLIPSEGSKVPNAKLRLLLDESVLNNGWKYLWIPPSIPYYNLSGAFIEGSGYSKTIVFSSWKMVPRMIASIVSYETERLSLGNPITISDKEKIDGKRSYFQSPRSPKPQLIFKVEKEEQAPQQMNNFILSYPCPFLAEIYDPASNLLEDKKINEIKNNIKIKIKKEFQKKNLNSYVSGSGEFKKWYWLVPILLDKANNNSVISEWFESGIPQSDLIKDMKYDGESEKKDSIGRIKHFDYMRSIFYGENYIDAPHLDKEQLDGLCDHIATLTLGSPAICFLRSLLRYNNLSKELLDASFNVALSFFTMFNKPESIAVVRLHTDNSEYWSRTLQYLVDGNIQAVLDEFNYLLINCENITSPSELSNYVSDILSIRTTTLEVDDLQLFLKNINGENKEKRSLRSHFAVDFGTQRIATERGAGRQINIRQAFNSPFKPFVLSSTSIGQEGLDFHLYCKKIFHWNLPSNPIDFEQREGRIHRYKGLVIRQNLAAKYANRIKYDNDKNNVWEVIFDLASEEKKHSILPCDLIPFWHTEPKDDIKIERYVPLYPFSKDIEKFNNLMKILTFYRLTFGQPRQEELIEALGKKGLDENFEDLIINLCPLLFRG